MEQQKQLTIYIGSDHRGFDLKEKVVTFLKAVGLPIIDVGSYAINSADDYTDYAIKVSSEVQKRTNNTRGILICGSGIGMYMVANKFKNIRAALCRTVDEAKEDRIEHDSNILILDENFIEGTDFQNVIRTWLTTPFEKGGRHERRLKKIQLLEEQTMRFHNVPTIVPVILSDSEDYIQKVEIFSQFINRLCLTAKENDSTHLSLLRTLKILELIESKGLLSSLYLHTKKPAIILEELRKYKRLYLVYLPLECIEEKFFEAEYPFDIGFVVSKHTDIEKYKNFYPKINVLFIEASKIENSNQIRTYGFSGEFHLYSETNNPDIHSLLDDSPTVLNVLFPATEPDILKYSYYNLKKRLLQ